MACRCRCPAETRAGDVMRKLKQQAMHCRCGKPRFSRVGCVPFVTRLDVKTRNTLRACVRRCWNATVTVAAYATHLAETSALSLFVIVFQESPCSVHDLALTWLSRNNPSDHSNRSAHITTSIGVVERVAPGRTRAGRAGLPSQKRTPQGWHCCSPLLGLEGKAHAL